MLMNVIAGRDPLRRAPDAVAIAQYSPAGGDGHKSDLVAGRNRSARSNADLANLHYRRLSKRHSRDTNVIGRMQTKDGIFRAGRGSDLCQAHARCFEPTWSCARRQLVSGLIAFMEVEIRQLELFLAVFEAGSVTRAAERVYLSPGAVSMQLQQLSRELRTELFIRSGRNFLPTPAARRLAEHARTVLAQVRQIEQEFEADATLDTRPFYFATGATALIYQLGKPLRQVRAKYPAAEIRVTVLATEQIVHGLLERRFDLGLITLPCDTAGLTIWPLLEEEMLVLKPSRTPVRRRTVGTLAPVQLKDAPFILYPHSSNMRGLIDQFLAECGVQHRVAMEADDTEAIKGMVESGFGYSILPEHAVKGPNRHFQTFRIQGQRLMRRQALAMPRTDYPRVLATAIAGSLRASAGVRGTIKG